MKYQNSQSGYSLVEVLIAITILLMATVGPMTIAARAQQSARYAREQNTAFFLAQEGIEAVVAIRNQNGMDHINNPGTVASDKWFTENTLNNCKVSNGCGLYFDDVGIVVTATCPVDGCPLYLNSTQRARYSHSAGATSTAYSRSVEVYNEGDSVRVTSKVSWQPTTGTARKTVELETYLFDIYNTN